MNDSATTPDALAPADRPAETTLPPTGENLSQRVERLEDEFKALKDAGQEPLLAVEPVLRLSLDSKAEIDLVVLEKRMQNLEKDVTRLKDTNALEQKIVKRVSKRLRRAKSSEHITATPPPTAAPRGASEPKPKNVPAGRNGYRWLLLDVVNDARLIPKMLFDRRYTMAWNTHMVVWLFIPAILLSGWWFPLAYLPILGVYLDKALDLLLAFCVYKALSREAHRYRNML